MRLVTSYINPDLDGVACGIVGAAHLFTGHEPGYAGTLAPEASEVLSHLGLEFPRVLLDRGDWDDVVLVDCHHPAQLPHVRDLSRVTVVVDHHPDGDAAAFPLAEVQNEAVGAAATLIAERIAARPGGLARLSSAHAALLACAVASNTLDFSAPSTTSRDRAQFDSLRSIALPDVALDDLVLAMRRWRHGFLDLATEEAVSQDVKIIETPFGMVAVAQLEGDGARSLLHRTDLHFAVERLAHGTNLVASMLSLVDTSTSTTTFVTADKRVRSALMVLLPEVLDEWTLELSILALRKTHVIPALNGA